MSTMSETTNLKFQTDGLRKRNSVHNKVLISFIITNTIVFLIMIFFNIAAGQDFGVFKNKTGDISDQYEVMITPAGATFSTWGVIYTWQALWVIFNITLIFIKYENERLYIEPPVLTIPFQVCIFSNFVANACWLALWDSQLFTWSLIFATFMALTAYAAVIISTRNTYNAVPALKKKKWVYWLYRILVNNGITFYATWLTIAMLINLAIAITYEWAPERLEQDYRSNSAIISLCFLAVLFFAYFACDIYFLEKYLRYTLSGYVQLIIAFTGILGKNWNGGEDPSQILALVLAIIVGICFIVKIVVTIYKACTNKNE